MRLSSWTDTRRKVWAEARRQKVRELVQPEVWNFIHPDDLLQRVSYSPPGGYDDVALKTYNVCSIWTRPIPIYNDHGTLPITHVYKIFDPKNDDTFYVSIDGDVWEDK